MVSRKRATKDSGRKKSTPRKPPAISDKNLQHLDRLANLGALSAGFAHEIKNGLVAIKTLIQLALERSEERDLATTAEYELNRIDSIVRQMLRLAAPKPVEVSVVHVHDILDVSLRLLHHQITGKTVSVTREFSAEPDTVCGDESQLQQVFMNLLLNALEALDVNGAMTVRTEISRSRAVAHLRILIQDNGVGISNENMSRLFEPFFTTKKNGTGLGLAISQWIARQHRGKIEAQSRGGEGSTFTIWLPAAEAV